MSEAHYHIHNTVRSPHTRAQRAANPTHSKTVLLLGGGSVRVLRGRPAAVSEGTLRLLHAELLEKEALGLVKVTTPRGDRIDLRTFKPVVPAPVPAPLPNPPLDSVQNDANTNVGQVFIQHLGNVPSTKELEPPRVGQRAIPEVMDEEDVPRAPEPELTPVTVEAPVEESKNLQSSGDQRGSHRKTGRR